MVIFQLFNISLKKGAKIDAKNKDQWNPLHFASLCGNTDVVKYLVLQRATKYSKMNNDETRKLIILYSLQYPKMKLLIHSHERLI